MRVDDFYRVVGAMIMVMITTMVVMVMGFRMTKVMEVLDVVLVVVEFSTVRYVSAEFKQVVKSREEEEEDFDKELLGRDGAYHHGHEEHELGGE